MRKSPTWQKNFGSRYGMSWQGSSQVDIWWCRRGRISCCVVWRHQIIIFNIRKWTQVRWGLMYHSRTSYFSCVTAVPLFFWCSCGSQVVPLFYFYRDGVLVAKFPTREKAKILEAINKYSSLMYEHVSTDDSVPKIPERNRLWYDGDKLVCCQIFLHVCGNSFYDDVVKLTCRWVVFVVCVLSWS